MAESSFIQWRVSATPIFVDEYTISNSLDGAIDGTKTRRITKTADGAQVIGGGESTTAQTAGNEARIEGAATVTSVTGATELASISGITASKTLTMLGIQIIGVDSTNTSTAVDLQVSIDDGSTWHFKIVGVGSGLVLPLNGISSDNIKYKSTSGSTTCKFKVCANRTD